jgi:hypothetical protein
MNPPDDRAISLLSVFQARAEARAILWHAGEYSDEDSAIAPFI